MPGSMCMCARVYVQVRVWVGALYIHVGKCMLAGVCGQVHACRCMCVHVYRCMHVWMHVGHARVQVHVCACMCARACMCEGMYAIHVYAGVYVCMCIVCRCMWGCLVQVYVCAGACGCRCIRRPDDNLCRSPGVVHLVFERGSFTEPRLSRLADEPQGSTSPSAVSASPAPGPQAYTTMAGISMWALGTKLRHSCLHDKHLTG